MQLNSVRVVPALAAALALTLPLLAQAGPAPFYESASFVDESVANGDYFVDNTRFLGATFTVSSAEKLSAIGGNFTLYGDGNPIFGAVVPVSGGVAGDVASTAVTWGLFTPLGGDQTVAVSATLQPGQYAVVFGSGLWGATGSSGLVAAQTALGTPNFLQYAGAGPAQAFADDTLRVTVYATATAVPEPSMALLWGAGSLALLALRRARRGQ